ncbi:Release factor glutamine methyltransferase [uncultured archaeon]|nr:Release factor glutamine methyltransferase [uncultured archaeon]
MASVRSNIPPVSTEVYPPAEDSWLLEEAILRENLRGLKCLDMGTGSGVQSVAMFRSGAISVLAVDINPVALAAAEKKVAEYDKKKKTQKPGHSFAVLESNLFSKVKGKFDLIAFNPPYVPTDGVKWVDLDGGLEGRSVINKFIPAVGKYLNPNGAVLLLISSLNNPQAIASAFFENGFSIKEVSKKKLFFEELIVIKAKKLF